MTDLTPSWLDSLDLSWAEGVKESDRLSLALVYLSVATYLPPLSNTTALMAAGSLVVAERQRLLASLPDDFVCNQETYGDLFVITPLMAVMDLTIAMNHESTSELDTVVHYLCICEVHIRYLWEQSAKD